MPSITIAIRAPGVGLSSFLDLKADMSFRLGVLLEMGPKAKPALLKKLIDNNSKMTYLPNFHVN